MGLVTPGAGNRDRGDLHPRRRKKTEHSLDKNYYMSYNDERKEVSAMDRVDVKIGQTIRGFREGLGMTQQELARRLGVSRPTISQIESGERRVVAAELERISEVFQVPAGRLLGSESEPEVVLCSDTPKGSPGPSLRTGRRGMRINVPRKNLTKFKEVLLYILGRVGSKPNVGESVIYKLLYFIDFDFYEKYEEQLVGATYLRNKYGPTPLEFKRIVERMIQEGDLEKVRSAYFGFPQTKYLPRRRPDLEKLTGAEKEVIDDVLNRLSDMSAAQISQYSHYDVPWLTTPEGRRIEYESVFYRTPAYSVRTYGEEV